MSNLLVMKFGGSSVGNAERIQAVAKIVAAARAKQDDVVVVTSAMSTVTDLLVSAAHHAARKNAAGLNQDLDQLHLIHSKAVADLKLSSRDAAQLQSVIDDHLARLHKLLESIFELAELTPRAHDLVVSFGERICIQILSQALSAVGVSAEPIEATRLIVTSDDFGNAMPYLEESEAQAKPVITALLRQNRVPVVTGFIGATSDGVITTLGRGGSDYSATILGYCLDAAAVEIWTDVDGVMTTDPRIVPEAHTIDALSYNEAAELSYFGAKVLHPLTIVPAVRKLIPVWIKNTFNPTHPGTRISDQVHETEHSAKAISIMKRVSLITVQGRGMLGVPGIAGKVFGAIAAHKINVLFISQASSEFNISLVVMHEDGERAVRILEHEFKFELIEHSIETITSQEQLAIIAVVGEGMKGSYGVAGKIFSALGQTRINIVAIAQGSSERNISLVIASSDITEAVQTIHAAFNMEKAGIGR